MKQFYAASFGRGWACASGLLGWCLVNKPLRAYQLSRGASRRRDLSKRIQTIGTFEGCSFPSQLVSLSGSYRFFGSWPKVNHSKSDCVSPCPQGGAGAAAGAAAPVENFVATQSPGDYARRYAADGRRGGLLQKIKICRKKEVEINPKR